MALRNLVEWGDPRFRMKSRAAEKFDARLGVLLDDLLETLKMVGGYGCAAVHVGVLRRVVVVNDDGGVIELVNPFVVEQSAETQDVTEGSIAPDSPTKKVKRPKSVTVSAFDRHGKPITVVGNDFLAATFCHEIEHLDGILYTDHAMEK